jgi:pimeloyl-ACP methyl ester carboxylesterase
MLAFTDWPADDLRAISAPTLFVCGDRDVIRVCHAHSGRRNAGRKDGAC